MSTMTMSNPDLAKVLFSSALQASDRPTPSQIRAAVADRLLACPGRAPYTAAVAQEAGDHPETYVARMRWALAAVEQAYQPMLAAA